MTTQVLSDELYGKLRRRLDEVARRVNQGTLPFGDTMKYLQRIIERAAEEGTYLVNVTTNNVEKLIKAGNYDQVDPHIHSEDFSVEWLGSCQVQLVHFGYELSTDEVLKQLRCMNLAPVTVGVILALGAKYPELQKQFPIVALGSHVADSACGKLFLKLTAYASSWSSRKLHLTGTRGNWKSRYRFAAVSN